MSYAENYLTAPPNPDAERARAVRADDNLAAAQVAHGALATAFGVIAGLTEFRHEEPQGDIAVGGETIPQGRLYLLNDLRIDLLHMISEYALIPGVVS